MGVNVNGSDSLKFVAELEIAAFEKNANKMEASITAASNASVQGTERQITANKKLQVAISDSKKEVEAYEKSMKGAASNTGPVNGKAGFTQQTDVNSARVLAAANKSNEEKAARESIGLIGQKKAKLEELLVTQEKTTDTKKLVAYNARIESITAEIKRLNNAGKVGFDDMGNKLAKSLDKPVGQMNRLTAAANLYKTAAAEATNPELITKYNRKLEETTAQLNQLKSAGKKGFDEVGNAINKPVGQFNRLTYAADLYKKAAANSTNPDIIAKYNRRLQDTQIELGRIGNVGKKGFDDMGNAIKGGTNFAGKAFSSLKLIANILPGVGLAGLLGFAIGPILEYIATLGIFKTKINEILKSRKEISDAQLKGSQDAQKELIDLRLMNKAVSDSTIPLSKRKDIYEEMQRLYPSYFGNISFEQAQAGRTKTAYDQLTASILSTARARAAADLITKNTSTQLENEQKIAEIDVEQKKLELQKKTREGRAVKDISRSTRENAGLGDIAAADKIQGDINDKIKEKNDLHKENNRLTSQNLTLEKEVTKQIKSGAQIAGGKFKDTKDKVVKLKVDNSADQARALQTQVDDILNKYKRKALTPDLEGEAAINDEFTKLATKVQQFNEDPKHKIKIGTDKLEEARGLAIENLRAERAAVLLKASLELAETFEQKKVAIIKKYNDAAIALGKGITDEQKAVLLEKRNAELDAETDTAFQKTEIYKQLNEDIGYYTKEQVKIQIASLEELLNAAKEISPELRSKLENELKLAKSKLGKSSETNFVNDLKNQKALLISNLGSGKLTTSEYERQLKKLKEINSELAKSASAKFGKISDDLKGVASIANDLSSAFEGVDSSISQALGKLGEMAAIGGNAAGASASFLSGDILGGATQAVSAITGIIKLISGDRAAQRKETAAYYATVYSGEKEYARMMRAREAIQENITNLTLKELEARKAMLAGQSSSAQKDYDQTLVKLRGEAAKQKELVDQVGYDKFLQFSSDKNKRDYENSQLLANSSFAELEKLFTEGRMSDSAKALFEELKKSKDELGDIAELEKAREETARRIRTGTTAEDLSNSLLSMFKEGKTGVQDFAEFFENTMKDAMFSTFKNDVLNKLMDGWYAEFDERSKDGLDETDISALNESLNKKKTEADDKLKLMQKATGLDFSSSSAGSSLADAIKGSITEVQADILSGTTNAIRMNQIQMLNIATRSLEVHVQNELNTRRLHEVVPLLKSMDAKLSAGSGAAAANGRTI